MATSKQIQDLLTWARGQRIAIHRVRWGDVEIECQDLSLFERRVVEVQDSTAPVEPNEYPDTVEGKFARDLGMPPPPGPGRKDDD